ncbi:MAG: (d)CMP kinase [Coriobacteriales bacterium]|nr:(d)CMP kinase [Coriobacteriales bacterium]
MIVAIDGPAGSGKSSISLQLALKYGFVYLDSGAMYRSVTLACLKNGVDVYNEAEVTRVAKESQIEFLYDQDGKQTVLLNGEDVTGDIRSSAVNAVVSVVSAHPSVRTALLDAQRAYGQKTSVVAEGRDTATTVFPNADLKIFLDASPETRALRRIEQNKQKGMLDDPDALDFEKVLESIRKRDEIDSSRAASPLKPAEDSIIIDTSPLTFDEVFSLISRYIDAFLVQQN